jgi:hypothetical protein
MMTALPPPHFGQMLKSHMRKHRYYQSALARDIGMRRESLADLLKRPDSKFSNLWKICFALRYNFLSDLAAQLPPTMPSAPTAKDQRIAELEQQLREMQTEVHTLQRVVEALQKV